MADSKEILDLTKLNGSNYSMWKFGVNFVLQSKELTGLVNGTEKEPDREKESKEWNSFIKKSSQAAVILLSSTRFERATENQWRFKSKNLRVYVRSLLILEKN